ncbi:L-threonylcarbamoyladenylate synthase [Prolixibacter sp. SD074]|jgi:L-threonylcarbamoyladenylate synthase|uniref:L-threonylcarbamoyladenylate synthase n=1 Tax=Prolixibacter sp. SD074 TaxID=2652391 RepID=UPI00127ABABF|nr:L-threonylcarbamoyladenylate synthase [Prolixibacter sp. SD074]GET30726.1 threonylcarbamoyl-AMP synthase [Prolixibacter sp. SD074]
MMESDFREDIRQAVEVLKKGGIILYPTDTIWGIGCDAANAEAVARIYQLKKRENSRSMLVLMENPNLLNSYIGEVPEVAWELVDVADKPLTIVYPGAKNLAGNLIAEDGSIGIRISGEPFTQQLIQRFRRPIVSTSANISSEPAPAFFDEISREIIDGVDYVVRYRQDDRTPALPSGIIKLGVNGEIQILRK